MLPQNLTIKRLIPMLTVKFWGILGTDSRRKTVVVFIVKIQLHFILQDVQDMMLLSS